MTDDRHASGHGRMSVQEAAAVAGVSRQTVHNWIAYGRLHPLLTDDGYRIDREEFRRFLAVRRVASAAGLKIDTLRHWTDAAGATG